MEKLIKFETEEQYLNKKESLEYPQVSLTNNNGKIWVEEKSRLEFIELNGHGGYVSLGIIYNGVEKTIHEDSNGELYIAFARGLDNNEYYAQMSEIIDISKLITTNDENIIKLTYTNREHRHEVYDIEYPFVSISYTIMNVDLIQNYSFDIIYKNKIVSVNFIIEK